MKTKKPRLKHNPIEYRLLLEQRRDENLDCDVLYVAIRTLKEFTSFQYELVVTDTLEGDTLSLHILGLRAPTTNIPTTGFASYTKSYPSLPALKTVVVKKMDKRENNFSVKMSQTPWVVKSKSTNPFIEVVTAGQVW